MRFSEENATTQRRTRRARIPVVPGKSVGVVGGQNRESDADDPMEFPEESSEDGSDGSFSQEEVNTEVDTYDADMSVHVNDGDRETEHDDVGNTATYVPGQWVPIVTK